MAGTPMTPQQVAQVAYQAGFRGDALVFFVAIAKRESSYNPAAHRTDNPSGNTGDYGLFQINYVNDTAAAKQAVGYTDRSQWLDPIINAKMAFYLSGGGKNLNPWKGSGTGWDKDGNPTYGLNLDVARQAVESAGATGLLGADYASGGPTVPGATSVGSTGTTGANAGLPASPSTPLKLPTDAKLYNTGQGLFAVFDVGGANVSYAVNWWDGSVDINGLKQTSVTTDQWNALAVTDGGNAEELRMITPTYGSFRNFFDTTMVQLMGKNNPAANDPEVKKIIAEYAGRPDMSPDELQGKLKATQWYQTHTQGQLAWNGLSDAEKQSRRDQTAAQMVDTWFQFTGERVAADDPRIVNYLEDVASGKTGVGAWTETVVKKSAAENPNSPYSRDTAQEQKNQKQSGVDIENTAQRVRDLAKRWGVQWSPGTYMDWATKITRNDASEADLIGELKTQANVLYQWKNPEVETQSAAQPWIETYNRVLEKQGDIFDPKVQAALTKGSPVWEFEQELKKSPEWLQTKNAKTDLTTAMTSVGKLMGYT